MIPDQPKPSDSGYLSLFQEVTRLITSTLNVAKVLETIAAKIPDVIGVDAATIRLLDPTGEKLLLLAAHGLSQEYLDRGPIDTEKSVMAALAGSPVSIYDAASDPRTNYSAAARKEGVKSILVAPIPIRGSISGVLRLLTREHRHFDEKEIGFVTALAEQCGIAIENARIYEDQQRQLQKITKLVTELEDQEEFLQNIMDSLNTDLFVLDAHDRITMVNRTFLKNHKLKESEVIGRPGHQIIEILAPDDSLIKKVKTENRTVVESRRCGKDKQLEITISPVSVFDPDGKTDFVIGTIQDITAHIRLQEEQRIRERLQGVLEMSGAAVHELNTPVFAALGTAQMLLKDLAQTDDQYDDLQTITRNLKHISELTRKMTQITRYEAKAYVGETKIVDIQKASDESFAVKD